jgi:hypothetical protein
MQGASCGRERPNIPPLVDGLRKAGLPEECDPRANALADPAYRRKDLFWNRGPPTSPYSPAVLDNDANRRHLLRNVQANKMGHR